MLRSKAGSEQVQSAIALLRRALQNVATETGLDPARFDPIATPLTRQGEGADAVLDLVKVSLTGNGARPSASACRWAPTVPRPSSR